MTPACFGQLRSSDKWAAEFYNHYRSIPDVTYKIIGNKELKLDVYQRVDLTQPVPTLFYVHGGGWEHGSKSVELGSILPWLAMGWAVVTVDYRLSGEAKAPAAVEDCRSALNWVAQNAQKYGFDLERLVISGSSSGGELALVTGMTPGGVGLDKNHPNVSLPTPAAFVNLSGVTDVNDLIDGPNRLAFAVAWIPSGPQQNEIARKVSPLTYISANLPPILSIHGDADQIVPYQQAVRFHEALTKAGVPNQLFTVKGGKHGGYSQDQYVRIYEVIHAFLATHHLSFPGSL